MSSANFSLAPLPLPAPVEEIRYDRGDEEETMRLRAGRLFVNWPYKIADCYSVGYVKRSLFDRPKEVRYLDPAKLEAKRREMFGLAYAELLRARAESAPGYAARERLSS